MKLIKQYEYGTKKKFWWNIKGTCLFLDETKTTLYFFIKPNDTDFFDVELQGETENSGCIYNTIEIGSLKKIKKLLK